MTTKFRNLKKGIDQFDNQNNGVGTASFPTKKKSQTNVSNYILLTAFLATFVFYIGSQFNTPPGVDNPIEQLVDRVTGPNQALLDGMGEWMTEMGYGELSRDELISLRQDGVTATNTSNLRNLGYTDLTLQDLRELGRAGVRASYVSDMQDIGYTDLTVEQLVELENADVSARFASMMQQLGYELTVEDLALLRRNGVTAHFTSNMHDLGYTSLTKEDLRDLRSIGVTANMVENLIDQKGGELPTLDEIKRYRISNQ